MNVDLALAKKYDRPAPRYTSYPTAPNFVETFQAGDFMKHIQAATAHTPESPEHTQQTNTGIPTAIRKISLYVHIPFCETRCLYCGCTSLITRDPATIEKYLLNVFKEMEIVANLFNYPHRVVQQHFGGGSPTSLSPDQIRRLGEKLRRLFAYDPDAEIACEIDPRKLSTDHIRAMREYGFNRASVGVQDFDPRVQNAVNRKNSKEMIAALIDRLRSEGFRSVNLDLIYGLPFQTSDSFAQTLESIISLDPDRLAVFNYAHIPWMKEHQRSIREEDLPTPDEKLKMLKMIVETLTTRGYVYIGMDHFAKESDNLTAAQRQKTLRRNFQGYSTHADADIHAFGMSSISQLDRCYSQNHKVLDRYYAELDAGRLPVERGIVLSDEDILRRTIIMRLMCDMELDFEHISRITGIHFKRMFAPEMERMDEFLADGLVRLDDRRLSITDAGRLFVRNIAMMFDAHLGTGDAKFSRTV